MLKAFHHYSTNFRGEQWAYLHACVCVCVCVGRGGDLEAHSTLHSFCKILGTFLSTKCSGIFPLNSIDPFKKQGIWCLN